MSEAVEVPAYAPADDPWQAPIDQVDPAFRRLFHDDSVLDHFARLRRDDPVHYHADSQFGPYWSITSYEHIKQVDTNHQVYSSAQGISIFDGSADFRTPMFIAMDPPKHDVQRKAVAPVAGPRNLAALEPEIRRRVCNILDALPVGETFNWVEKVSIELTTQMLATLFDFPFEERYKLTRWSDVATNGPDSGIVETMEQRRAELLECLGRFTELWHERAARPCARTASAKPNEVRPPGNDLISMLAHGESTRDMVDRPMEYLGNLILLIVGGNDTTRNSISGGVLALNQYPEEYAKLRASVSQDDTGLIPNMVAEIIRWQTPLTHMRRTVLEDTELAGKTIRAGDKVVMWYLSGNRDASVFEDADRLIIDRKNARSHMSFGFGIHRCMGNRVGEMQLRILWEEIMKRFQAVEVVGEPVRTRHVFIRGFTELPVRVVPH